MTLLLGFSAVNTGNNLLFLLVSALLAFMSVTGYVGMLNIKGITLQLLPPPDLYATVPATITFRLTNSKRRLPSFLISLQSGDSRGEALPLLRAAASVDLPLPLCFPRRGEVLLPAVRVSSPFPVNFFIRYWIFDLHQQLMVFPAPLTLSELPGSRVEASGAVQRQQQQQQRGYDGELERIAPYSGRESLKTIHWKLTARGSDMLVKQFGSQSAPPLLIELDHLPGADLETRVSQGAWLVKRWCRERPVGLLAGEITIPARVGKQHEHHLLSVLACYGLR